MNNKILVVDDDLSINELIKINLELAGYQVVQAFDGIKGFALAKHLVQQHRTFKHTKDAA